MKSSDSEKPRILFEDSHLFVVYKPAGMVVPIEDRGIDSLEGYCKELLKKRLHKANIFLRPIHRLDKPVEGIVVFARSSKALSRLNQEQREKQIEKFYVAEVSGRAKKKQGLLIDQMIHGDYRAEFVEKGGKEAKLRYRVVQEKEDTSILSIKLLTGRYHQIRAQLSKAGHPILGDQRYQSRKRYKKNQIALVHTKMVLKHPTLKKKMVFKWRPQSF